MIPERFDWASEFALYGHCFMHIRARPRKSNPNDRITTISGKVDGPNPWNPHIRKTTEEEARRYAERLADSPSLRCVIINTEWTPPMDFGERFRREVLERFGLDITKWRTTPENAWRVLHPHNRLRPNLLGEDRFPKGGVVPLEDRFYRFHFWWHHGGGNEVPINETCSRAVREARNDAVRIVEPVLRAPPLKRYTDVDVAEEWFYYYNPRIAITIQEQLGCVSRNRDMRPSGMRQFLFKPGGVSPYAGTPPPDMLKEVLSLCLSRPLSMMTFWGWHRVLEQGKMSTHSELRKIFEGLQWKEALKKARELGGETGGLYIPEVKDEFRRFSEEVWKPLGPLMKRWVNSPRRIAVILSFASWLYDNIRWDALGRTWLGGTILSSGLPFDFLYDESFFEEPNALEQYRVVILPDDIVTIPQPVHRALRRFVRSSGVVLGDKNCPIEGIPPMKRSSKDEIEKVRKLIIEVSDLPVRSSTPEVFWNLLELDGAKYLAAVNDKREFGKYYGQWKRARERGIPQRASLKVRHSLGRHLYQLISSEEINVKRKKDWAEFKLDLPPSVGRIILFVTERPTELRVEASRSQLSRGENLSLRFTLAGERGRVEGAIPLKLSIREPSGRIHDRSVIISCGGGVSHLNSHFR